jgi:hypothetical protein
MYPISYSVRLNASPNLRAKLQLPPRRRQLLTRPLQRSLITNLLCLNPPMRKLSVPVLLLVHKAEEVLTLLVEAAREVEVVVREDTGQAVEEGAVLRTVGVRLVAG